MKYEDNKQLPQYVKTLPIIVQTAWRKVFNESTDKFGIEQSSNIANSWIKARLTKTSDGYVANSKDFGFIEVYSFELTPANEAFISNSADGDIILTAVLSDNQPWINPNTGAILSYTDDCLKDFANQINTEGITLPDIEHQEWDSILAESANPEEVKAKMLQRKGLLRTIKAHVDNGKLYIQAKLDKRYKNYADAYQKLSLEAYAKREGSKVTGGKILGFTFTKKPVNSRADIISAQ